ncbi:MAG: MarC family protein [Rhodobacteraceae bacterium]|nr:MarC family protein [Paracoccaceae bacterium]
MNWTWIYRELITLIVVIDPIGTIPIFLATTASMSNEVARKVAVRAVLISAVVLLFFLVLGQIVFEALGLQLGAFQISGGIVLLLFALSMIFGPTKADREIEEANHKYSAVFPLSIPSIASPGAMLAVVILTDNQSRSLMDQSITAGLLAVVLLITLLLLLIAKPIQKLLGKAGTSVISRVMGIILATVAVDSILNGFAVLGVIQLAQ